MEHQNGNMPSRIPRFTGNKPPSGLQPEPLPNIGTKLSKLEQMQADYQKNILREKEEKMISLYEENQHRALQKVNQKKGHVRDFFNERRGINNGDNALSPPIEHHYQQKRMESKTGGPENGYPNRQSPKYMGYMKGVQKQSAGRDRSNLLAPIQRNNQENENPFLKRKPQIVRPRTMGKLPNKEIARNGMNMPMSAPTGEILLDNTSNYNGVEEDDSPLPNPQQLQQLQQKRKFLQSQRSSTRSIHTRYNGSSSHRQTGGPKITPDSGRKPSSLHTYDYEQSDEDEGFADNNDDEMKRKQQELLAQINAQQRELSRLRNERKQAEADEARDAEHRKKVEEERRKKYVEEEQKRLRAQEEERMRELIEEEKYQKQEAERRRMRHTSKNSRTNDSDSGYMNDDYDKTPTPPPKPKPANTRKKPVPQKRAPARQANTPSPLPKGDHLAVYENAINEEGAYENVGRLKACFNCGRKFAEERLEKHEQFCRNATKKRKVMDASKLRTKGTEMENYLSHRATTPKKKNNWRSKHESFIEAVRYAKKCSQIEKEGGNLADLPPPPPSENPDYVQCPHCTRKFNVSAAERHIPHCKNSRAKPPPQRRR